MQIDAVALTRYLLHRILKMMCFKDLFTACSKMLIYNLEGEDAKTASRVKLLSSLIPLEPDTGWYITWQSVLSGASPGPKMELKSTLNMSPNSASTQNRNRALLPQENKKETKLIMRMRCQCLEH